MLDKLSYIKTGLVALSLLVVALFALGAVSLGGLLTFSYIMLGALVVATLLGAILKTVEKPQSGMRFVVGLVAILIVFGISWGMSDNTDPRTGVETYGAQFVQAGWYTFVFMAVIALLSLVASAVLKWIK